MNKTGRKKKKNPVDSSLNHKKVTVMPLVRGEMGLSKTKNLFDQACTFNTYVHYVSLEEMGSRVRCAINTSKTRTLSQSFGDGKRSNMKN